MKCEIVPQPVRVGPATITISLLDTSETPVSGAHIQIEADMSHPGMAPVFGDVKEMAPGRYTGRLNFTMAGDWVVLVNATFAGGRTLERQIDVRGVRAI